MKTALHDFFFNALAICMIGSFVAGMYIYNMRITKLETQMVSLTQDNEAILSNLQHSKNFN